MSQGYAAGLNVIGPAISAGAALVSTGTVLFSNANGVTFGITGQTLTASAAGGGGGGSVNLSAGTTSQNLTNFVFSNSNGISFGLSGSTVTGTVQTNYLTTAMQSNAATISNVNLSAGTTSQNLSAFVFSNSNNVSFGLSGSTVTGTVTVATSLSNVRVSAGTTSNLLSAITFSNANGVSFGLNGSTLTGSVAAAGGAQTGISGIQISDTTYTSGTVTFQNANGISFGSSGGNGISASYTVPTVTNSSLTLSDNATSILIGKLAFSQSNGLTLSLSTTTGGSATVVGSYTQSAQAISAQGGSSTFSTLVMTNSNNVSFSNTGGSIWGSFALNVSATGGTSNALSGLTFKDSNGVSFGLSTGAGVGTLTASHNGITSQSNQQMTLFATSNTTQSSTGTTNASSVIYAGAGAVSIGISNGSIVVSAPKPVTHSVWCPTGAAGFMQSTQLGNGTMQVWPITPENYVAYDRLLLGIHLQNSSNSSGSHTLSQWFGLYTRNGSSLSLASSVSTSDAFTLSGTVGNFSNLGFYRLQTWGWTQTLSPGDWWAGYISSSSSSGSNCSLNNIVFSALNSQMSGLWNAASNDTQQRLLGQGFYTASTGALPNAIGFSELNGGSVSNFRVPWVAFQSGTV